MAATLARRRPPSSSGPGLWPFTPATRVRIPLGVWSKPCSRAGVTRRCESPRRRGRRRRAASAASRSRGTPRSARRGRRCPRTRADSRTRRDRPVSRGGSCRVGARRRAPDGSAPNRARLEPWRRRCLGRAGGLRRTRRRGVPPPRLEPGTAPGAPAATAAASVSSATVGCVPSPRTNPPEQRRASSAREESARSATCTVDQCCRPVPSMIRLPSSSRGDPSRSPGIPRRRRRTRCRTR